MRLRESIFHTCMHATYVTVLPCCSSLHTPVHVLLLRRDRVCAEGFFEAAVRTLTLRMARTETSDLLVMASVLQRRERQGAHARSRSTGSGSHASTSQVFRQSDSDCIDGGHDSAAQCAGGNGSDSGMLSHMLHAADQRLASMPAQDLMRTLLALATVRSLISCAQLYTSSYHVPVIVALVATTAS